MRTTIRMLFGLAAVGATWTGAVGCGSEEKVIQPITHCVGYQNFGYWHKEEPPTLTVCTNGDQPLTLQFKGPDGLPVPGGGTLSAPGCVTMPFPPDASTFDWIEAPPSDGSGAAPLVAAPFSPWAVPSGVQSEGSQEYTFGCSTMQAWSTEVARTYLFKAMASSLSQAQSLVNPILYVGPSAILPYGVKVGYYIESQMVGLDLVIRSSLNDRFDHFQVAIDGQVVADLHAGLNVQSEASGARWTTVTATIPLYLLSETMDLTLHQQGKNDPNELQIAVDF